MDGKWKHPVVYVLSFIIFRFTRGRRSRVVDSGQDECTGVSLTHAIDMLDNRKSTLESFLQCNRTLKLA